MARDYSTVRSSFWTGETGLALRGDPQAQLLAIYFVTCPAANMIGLYYLPWPTICFETGMSEQGASKALRRVSEVGFASYDRATSWVFVPQMAFYQLGAALQPKDKRISSVQSLFSKAVKCRFAQDFWNLYGEAYHIENIRGFEGASKGDTGCRNSFPPEPEPEPEPDIHRGKFKKPTLEEVKAYCSERGNLVSAQSWYDHYESNGWKVGKNAMKNWRAAVRKWEHSEFRSNGQTQPRMPTAEEDAEWTP